MSVPTVGVPPQVGDVVPVSAVGGCTVGASVGFEFRDVKTIVDVLVGNGVSIVMGVGLAVTTSLMMVGSRVPCCCGVETTEGARVSRGVTAGLEEGESVGLRVGVSEGDRVGSTVGFLEGESVVGAAVTGLNVGPMLGLLVGDAVGAHTS